MGQDCSPTHRPHIKLPFCFAGNGSGTESSIIPLLPHILWGFKWSGHWIPTLSLPYTHTHVLVLQLRLKPNDSNQPLVASSFALPSY